MRNRFDRQLEELKEMLIHMGELCETAIEEATGALEGHDIARAKAVITADSEIDQMEKEIENLCLKLLLQQQPVARDLRIIFQYHYIQQLLQEGKMRYCPTLGLPAAYYVLP